MLLILHFFLIFDGVFCASLAHFSTNQHSVIHVKQCAVRMLEDGLGAHLQWLKILCVGAS